jgi:multidrug efflux pump subunit AcrB
MPDQAAMGAPHGAAPAAVDAGGGGIAYVVIPKEAAPDIDIPIFFVTVTYSGISPEDSERLLVRPLERELLPVAGLKELQPAPARASR